MIVHSLMEGYDWRWRVIWAWAWAPAPNMTREWGARFFSRRCVASNEPT